MFMMLFVSTRFGLPALYSSGLLNVCPNSWGAARNVREAPAALVGTYDARSALSSSICRVVKLTLLMNVVGLEPAGSLRTRTLQCPDASTQCTSNVRRKPPAAKRRAKSPAPATRTRVRSLHPAQTCRSSVLWKCRFCASVHAVAPGLTVQVYSRFCGTQT